MLIFVAVGLMNLPWMIAITLIVSVEKVWRYGHHVAAVVGIGLLLLGILTAVDPRLISRPVMWAGGGTIIPGCSPSTRSKLSS